ncbi:hypothetical protein MRB53_040502 [Persea americana]|nr:hypothetical protein MRB53_040502 [Persea americana]
MVRSGTGWEDRGMIRNSLTAIYISNHRLRTLRGPRPASSLILQRQETLHGKQERQRPITRRILRDLRGVILPIDIWICEDRIRERGALLRKIKSHILRCRWRGS